MRFYFNLRDGDALLLDPEGVELPNIDAVARRAHAAARDLLSEELREGRVRLDLCLDVRDEAGSTVYGLPFIEAIEVVSPSSSDVAPTPIGRTPGKA